MFRFSKTCVATLILMAFSSHPAFAQNKATAPSSAEQAFRAWGDLAAAGGGVWTSKDAQGNTLDDHWEWILNKSFLKLTAKGAGASFEIIGGIDPASSKWTWWGFDSLSGVSTGSGSSDKAGSWTFAFAGRGKNGAIAWKGNLIQTGPDSMTVEILENVIDGKATPPEKQTWTRKK